MAVHASVTKVQKTATYVIVPWNIVEIIAKLIKVSVHNGHDCGVLMFPRFGVLIFCHLIIKNIYIIEFW